MKSESKPLEKAVWLGEAFRVAPSRHRKPAAFFWKFWVSGNEVYAMSRNSGNIAKISVHATGQIHMRFEGKDLQQLAPPLLLGKGQWLHAFELRFLVSPDAYPPPTEKLRTKRAFLIELPPERVLIMNLLVGQAGCSAATDLPHEFLPAAKPVWQSTLRDQRPVVLIARVFEMDKQNSDAIMSIRHEINPKINFSKPPAVAPYMEIWRIVWNAKGGNVVLVVPMGKEAFRVHDDSSGHSSTAAIADSRTISISSPSVSIPIAAPNGAIVGTVSIAGATTELALKKNVEVRRSLGIVTLSVNSSNLISGQSFRTPSSRLSCVPTIDGIQPRNWDYSIFFSFDGAALTAEVRQLSAGLRNVNVERVAPSLGSAEEILVVAPFGGLVLRATAAAPQSSATLEGRFLLRDI